MAERFFCSNMSLENSESILGSAHSVQGMVFITWPKKYWAFRQLNSRFIPEELRASLQQIQKERGVFARLISRPGMQLEDTVSVYIMPQMLGYSEVPINAIPEVILSGLDNRADCAIKPRDLTGNFVFCCTNGKRDRCCAKFGYSTFRALDRLAQQSSEPFEVWECTHLTGDRFAATAVSFPSGQMYGYMREDVAKQIYEGLVEGIPFAPCYRGNVLLRGPSQLVEAYSQQLAHQRHKRITRMQSEFGPTEANSDGHESCRVELTVQFDGGDEVFESLSLSRTPVEVYSDCRGLDRSEKRTLLRWQVTNARKKTHGTSADHA